MARSLTTFPPPGWGRVVHWLRQPKVGAQLALALTAAAGWLNVAAEPDLVLGLLYLDLILLLLLGAVVARRLVQLIVARRQGLAGSRLHARLVAMFETLLGRRSAGGSASGSATH